MVWREEVGVEEEVGLTYRGGQADEAGPMVLDQLAHAAREPSSEAMRRMNNNRVVTADGV